CHERFLITSVELKVMQESEPKGSVLYTRLVNCPVLFELTEKLDLEEDSPSISDSDMVLTDMVLQMTFGLECLLSLPDTIYQEPIFY
ncbi:hypothetical protein STEG23_028993, partial [Scotinomys teguina]